MAPERHNAFPGNQLRNSSSIFSSIPPAPTPPTAGAVPSSATNPPPLPPRQSTQAYSGYNDYRPTYNSSYYGGYNGYQSQYRGYGGGYGGYSGGYLSPYSPYNSGYNYGQQGGPSGDVENRWMQYAEESTRSTFRAVETVLQTFSSMTMLLESTHFALTSSFRAILGLAENIDRMRTTFGRVFSVFALVRLLKLIYRKLLYFTGIQNQGTVEENLWQKSLVNAGNTNQADPSSRWSSVLVLSMLSLIIYAIHKITSNIKRIHAKGKDPREWHELEEPVYVATALYDFAASSRDEMSLRIGQKVWLAPQSLQPKTLSGWYLATDNQSVGLIPSNYIKIVGQLKRNLSKPSEAEKVEQQPPQQQPVPEEIS